MTQWLLLVLPSLYRCDEEFQPILTADFPHLIGTDRLQAWTDPALNPCQNFYDYACGNKLNNQGGFFNRYHHFKSTDVMQLMGETNSLLMKQILEKDVDSLKHSDRPEMDIFYKTRDYFMSCMHKGNIETRGFKPIKLMAIDLIKKTKDSPLALLLGTFQSQGIEILFNPIYSKVQFHSPNDMRLQLIPSSAYDVKKETISKVMMIFRNEGVLESNLDMEMIVHFIYKMEMRQLKLVKSLNEKIESGSDQNDNQYVSKETLSRLTRFDFDLYLPEVKLDQIEAFFLWGDSHIWIKNLRTWGKQRHLMKFYFLWRLATSHFNKLSEEFKSLWYSDIYPHQLKAYIDDFDEHADEFQQGF
jgi:hypothetical protein